MDVNKFLEKVSWKLHRKNFRLVVFSAGYHGGTSSGHFIFLGFVDHYKESSLLSWSFRLPNKTHVSRFITDSWDFLYLRNYLYNRYESLIDKELWTLNRMTKMDRIKLKVLSKLF
jgi:hypothetical protein